jgi:hypothetical protein
VYRVTVLVLVTLTPRARNPQAAASLAIEHPTRHTTATIHRFIVLAPMGQNGWEFVQAYTLSEPSGGQVYRWLLKRAIK